MSGNNNNDQSWKIKLDELERLPGEVFDKEKSWQKLHGRSKADAGNKKRVWYWLAAACLVGVISFSWFFAKENNNLPVAKTIVPVVKNEWKDSTGLPVIEQKVTLENAPKEKTAVITKIIAPPKIFRVADTVITINPPPQLVSAIVVTPEPALDTMKLLALAPVKKKLKLIHFNDLNNDPGNIIISDENGKPFFPVKFQTKEIYTNNAGSSGTGRDNLIRIKLSSQN